VDRPFLLLQLTDLHIGASSAMADPAAGLEDAVRAIAALPTAVDSILISGDLTDHGLDSEYEQVAEIVGRLGAPVHVLPGNHDDRDRLRRRFAVPGGSGTTLQYSVNLGPMLLVALDTTVPGSDAGELGAEQLAWLDRELSESPGAPTLIAMHHPPFLTAMPAFDRIGLPAADRRGLEEIVARHPQVQALVAGHVHRLISARVAGRPSWTAPGTYLHALLRFGSGQLEFAPEPRGFVVHALLDGELVSHVELIHSSR
jgi:3',5'-cyclic AMP phosphodiesterase CpdA